MKGPGAEPALTRGLGGQNSAPLRFRSQNSNKSTKQISDRKQHPVYALNLDPFRFWVHQEPRGILGGGTARGRQSPAGLRSASPLAALDAGKAGCEGRKCRGTGFPDKHSRVFAPPAIWKTRDRKAAAREGSQARAAVLSEVNDT